jgi:DivIVA domain-containing protein
VDSERSDGSIANLRTVEFKLALRGYDVDAVDVYLETLATSLANDQLGNVAPTPEAIERQTFRLSLRGYSTKDVEAFLKAVADELRERPYS